MNERDMSLLKAVGEAVREQLTAIQGNFEKALNAQTEKIRSLESVISDQKALIDAMQQKTPDENAIINDVLSRIKVPSAPELPDISKMVTDAVAAIPRPVAPELPDIGGMVKSEVAAQIAEIEPQQPEPLPDIGAMVTKAVNALPAAKDGDGARQTLGRRGREILPGIDSDKSYMRGTFAHHSGGLWRSFQKTTGMNGWECLVDGVASVDITQDDERSFTITALQASGVKTEKTFSVPVMIYRDIFKEGEQYQPGDSVTWGGSVWYCHEQTTDKPGEPGAKGWKLAVKRGRDARPK